MGEILPCVICGERITTRVKQVPGPAPVSEAYCDKEECENTLAERYRIHRKTFNPINWDAIWRKAEERLLK